MEIELTKKLLDAAKAMTGSDNQTAIKAFTTRARISDYRAGRLNMTVADTVLIANLAGMDGVEWGSRAIEAQHAGTEKGAALSQALKKALAQTGAVSDTFTKDGKLETYFIRCIVCKVTILRNFIINCTFKQSLFPG